MTLLLRIYLLHLDFLGYTFFQSLRISPKPLSSNPIHSFFPSSWESTVVSGKPYSVSDVSRFRLQLVSIPILLLIIRAEGIQNKLINDSLKLLDCFSSVRIVFKGLCIFAPGLFQIIPREESCFNWDMALFPLMEIKRLVQLILMVTGIIKCARI